MKHVNRKIHDEKLRLKDHYKLAMLQLWFMGMFVIGLANRMERNINKITEHGVTIWNGGNSLIRFDASFPAWAAWSRGLQSSLPQPGTGIIA